MVEILDISVGLSDRLPTWPGGVGFHIEQTKKIEQDGVNVSKIESCVHVGTHVDAPSHFVAGGNTVEDLSLQVLMGPVTVVSVPEASSITGDLLNSLAVPPGTKRLLFKTKNSELWTRGVKEFKRDYVALTADAAQWVVDRDIRLVGVDYLSVQRFQDSPLTHEILLKAGVIIVEGLNLAKVEPGEYELVCLPLKIIGSEGAPARAVLVRDRP